jgi:hypothetical protein
MNAREKKVSELFLQTTHPKSVSDYFHCYNSNNILNVIYWWKFFEMISKIPGDIVECGVGRGRSLITITSLRNYLELSNPLIPKRKIFALDSFEGFPEPTQNDSSIRNPKKGEWSKSPNHEFDYSITEISKVLNFAELDVSDSNRLEFVKGFFNDSTPKLNVEKIAILHLDGDLYESVLSPLKNLWSKVQLGGLIVIDDYILEDSEFEKEAFPGARKVVNEFLNTNKCFECRKSIRGTPYLIRIR